MDDQEYHQLMTEVLWLTKSERKFVCSRLARSPLVNGPRTLSDLCCHKIIQDSSACQLARFLLPVTLLDRMIQLAFQHERDRSLYQLLQGWPSPDLVLQHVCPHLDANTDVPMDYDALQAHVQMEYKCLALLFSALRTRIPSKLEHLDLSGFRHLQIPVKSSKSAVKCRFPFAPDIQVLLDAGIKVTMDCSIFTSTNNFSKRKGRVYNNLGTMTSSRNLLMKGNPSDFLVLHDMSVMIDFKQLTKLVIVLDPYPGTEDVSHLQLLENLVNIKEFKVTCHCLISQAHNENLIDILARAINLWDQLTSLDLDLGPRYSALLPHLQPVVISRLQCLKMRNLSPLDIDLLAAMSSLQHLDIQEGCSGYTSDLCKMLPQLTNLQILQLNLKFSSVNNKELFVQCIMKLDKLCHLILPEEDAYVVNDIPPRINLHCDDNYFS